MSKASKSRMIGYRYEFDQHKTDDAAIEKFLQRSSAVMEFDVGRGVLWFNGMPGQPLRSVRDEVKRMLGK